MKNFVESSRSFKKHELACPCCGEARMDPVFMTRLQAWRDYVDIPVTLASAYRCRDYNATIPGAAEKSQHTEGKAVDPRISHLPSSERYRLMEAAFKFGFTGIGFGKRNLHLDTRPGTAKIWGY